LSPPATPVGKDNDAFPSPLSVASGSHSCTNASSANSRIF
jgi:hypothetical protein